MCIWQPQVARPDNMQIINSLKGHFQEGHISHDSRSCASLVTSFLALLFEQPLRCANIINILLNDMGLPFLSLYCCECVESRVG